MTVKILTEQLGSVKAVARLFDGADIAHCLTMPERRLQLDKAQARKQRTREVQKQTGAK